MNRRNFLKSILGLGIAIPAALTVKNISDFGTTIKIIESNGVIMSFQAYDYALSTEEIINEYKKLKPILTISPLHYKS